MADEEDSEADAWPHRTAFSVFSVDDSLAGWNMPVRDWLIQNQQSNKYDGMATGSIVFNAIGKALVVQRASHDSLPNRWEFPGGAADQSDKTIFHAAARELWEESGLIATRFTHVVTEGPEKEPGEVFQNRARTKVFIRFTFHAEVESSDEVKLDPNEHQDYAWVSEEEIQKQMIRDRQLTLTRSTVRNLFLEAFRLRKKRLGTL